MSTGSVARPIAGTPFPRPHGPGAEQGGANGKCGIGPCPVPTRLPKSKNLRVDVSVGPVRQILRTQSSTVEVVDAVAPDLLQEAKRGLTVGRDEGLNSPPSVIAGLDVFVVGSVVEGVRGVVGSEASP